MPEKFSIKKLTEIYGMKKLLILLSLVASLNCFAQEEKQKGFDPTNLFTGGSVSLGFSGGYYSLFLAGVHPHFGYTIAKWLDVAAVANFEYQSQRDGYNNKYHNTTYGLGAFTRIYPVHFLFIQAEPEYNFIDVKYIPATGFTTKQNFRVPSLLLGGGYTTSRSDKNSFTYLSVLVDVIKDANSPYVDGYGNLVPIIRAGINIGLNRKKRK
jgi:hypothetical protein